MQTRELLAEIDSLKAEIERLRPLKPEVEHKIMQKFRLDWNYHSNAIEGNQLTLGETRAFLMEGLTASGKPLKDHLDIKGHNELIDFLQLYIQQKQELTEADIREMHKILLREPYETEVRTEDGRRQKKVVELGVYKTTPNAVETSTGEVRRYALPDDVAPLMAKLVKWHREESSKQELHPLMQASVLHHQFLSIHPFDDGNGRLGRILMNLILMRHGFPPLIIKNDQRNEYVAALRQADAGVNTPLIDFLAGCLLDSMRLYLRGAKGESIEDADDVDKQVALLKRELEKQQNPVQLSYEVQGKVLLENLTPLIDRINVKLSQFDELFAKCSVQINWVWSQGSGDNSRVQACKVTTEILGLYVNGPKESFSVQGESPTTIGEIAMLLDKKQRSSESIENAVLRSLEFDYRWEGFQKDGANAFDVNVFFPRTFRTMAFSD